MILERLFLVSTLAVLPLWLLLICAPRAHWTKRGVQSAAPFLLLALLYAWSQALDGEPAAGADFRSLEGVRILFSSEAAMLAIWLHFLAVDLFVGAWMVRDAAAQEIRHLWIVPPLIITFALAPIGLALYLVLRSTLQGSMDLDHSKAALRIAVLESGRNAAAG